MNFLSLVFISDQGLPGSGSEMIFPDKAKSTGSTTRVLLNFEIVGTCRFTVTTLDMIYIEEEPKYCGQSQCGKYSKSVCGVGGGLCLRLVLR